MFRQAELRACDRHRRRSHEHFLQGTFDELYVVYNEFKSAIQQRVIVEKLFPIDAAAEFGTAERDARVCHGRELSLRAG